MANRPGELARLCEMLADRGVNLVMCGVAHGDHGAVAFIADDEYVARDAMRESDIDFFERDALTVRNGAREDRHVGDVVQADVPPEVCDVAFDRLEGEDPAGSPDAP